MTEKEFFETGLAVDCRTKTERRSSLSKDQIFRIYKRNLQENQKMDTYLQESIARYVDGEGTHKDNENPVFITPALHFKPVGFDTEGDFWRYFFNFLQKEPEKHFIRIGTPYLNFPAFIAKLLKQ